MKVRMIQDWGGYKKDEVVTCEDEEGCRLICTAVACVEEAKSQKQKPGASRQVVTDATGKGAG